MCEESWVRPATLLRRQAIKAGLVFTALPRFAFAETPDPSGGETAKGLDAQARWLAGIAPLPGLAPSAEWHAYAQREDERWRTTRSRLLAMEQWSTQELRSVLPAEYALFYPFGGPDALHAIALFGAARRLVLVGLEDVGSLPDVGKALPAGFFHQLSASLGDVHQLTFFRTHEMSTDFRRYGVIAALVTTIARMGGKIVSVQRASSRARIDWLSTNRQARRLDYLQADLSNAGLKGAPQLAAELHAMAPYVTFVKAAMYLLAEPRFSSLRQSLLDDSAVVVEDDTGIPLRYLDERWTKRLFGAYEAPGAPYEARLQPKLRAAYEGRAVSALPFGIGYHVQPSRSNLLVASKGR